MKFRVFDTEAEAIAAEAQVAQAIGCIKTGTNAKTGLPAPEAQATERWAILQQITDGRWVFQSIDDTGEEPGADWWLLSYDPSVVARLSYWIDPDDSDTVALSGSTITTIQDKVGGTSATQLEARGGVPTPDLTTISGRDWIDSNGTNEVLQLGDGTAAAVNMGSGSYTMFAVVRPTFTTGARSIFSKGFTGFYSMRSGSGVPNLALVHYFDDVGGAAYTSVSSPGAVLVQNQRHVLRFTCDRGAATISAHVDGVSVATPVSIAGRGSIDDTSQNLVVCGRAAGGGQTEFWQGQIGEILFYKAAVGASDITDIEAYLTAKWLA